MAIPLLPLLKAIPSILGTVRDVTSSLRARKAAGDALATEERTRKLEDDLLHTGQALAQLAQEVEVIAGELRAQSHRLETQRKHVTVLFWTSIATVAAALTALIMAWPAT